MILLRLFIIFLISGLIVDTSVVHAEKIQPHPKPLQAKVGVFITDLHSFDLRNQSYHVTFWAWFIYPSAGHYKPESTTEIVNAHTYSRSNFFTAKRSNLTWSSIKFTGKIAHQWDISNFPFDRQKFQIILEDADLDYSSVQYVADLPNSKVDSNIHLPDWETVSFDIQAGSVVYQTTYGDPDIKNGSSTYARITISLTLQRRATKLFFNMFLALYVAFLLSALAFLIPVENTSPRLSLATGAIFAVIGNKYLMDSTLPLTTALTLVDKVQILTLIFISISALMTVLFTHLGSQHEKLSRTINRFGKVIFPVSYVIFNVYWIYHASSATAAVGW